MAITGINQWISTCCGKGKDVVLLIKSLINMKVGRGAWGAHYQRYKGPSDQNMKLIMVEFFKYGLIGVD